MSSRSIRSVVVMGALALAGRTALPQESTEALSQRIQSRDWGISRWPDIRVGQVSVIHAPGKNELQLRHLGLRPRPVFSGPRRAVAPACKGNCFLLAAFNSGIVNSLGGYFNGFARLPSRARVILHDWDDGRRALTLNYEKQAAGYCGAWVHLFDFTLPDEERVYFDSTPFSYLTFWIRGRQGGERILLKVADANWEQKQDALPVAEVASFLSGHAMEPKWQRVTVPLAAIPKNLDRRELAALVFEVLGVNTGSIAVKDIAFCKKPEPLPALSPPARLPAVRRKLAKALWIWNTAEFLESPERRQELVTFATSNEFTDVFLQLPGATRNAVPHQEIRLETGKWRLLLSVLSRNGLRAHALDGFSDYALSEWHESVLRTVDNVIRYNQSVQPDQAFYGIHYDVEPYLIQGFYGARRGRILQSYLELLEKIAAKARPAGLHFGVDIPFWFDSRDDFTGEKPSVEFHGVQKLLSEHVIDLTDGVAVMDYRTFAFGADGVLALAKGELEYAERRDKTVFVGLETTVLPDEELIEFAGEPFAGVPAIAPNRRAIVLVPDGDAATLEVIEPSQWRSLRVALEKRAPESLLWWPAGRAVQVPGDKLSFARPGLEALEQAMAEAEEELSAYRSFAGFAIHDYAGYRRLIERGRSAIH